MISLRCCSVSVFSSACSRLCSLPLVSSPRAARSELAPHLPGGASGLQHYLVFR